MANETLEMQMELSQDLLAEALNVAEDITNMTTQVEVYNGQVEQWRPLLRKHVDSLVMELKRTDALEAVYRAEDHAQRLDRETEALNSSLSWVCNASHNSSRVFQANSSVRGFIRSAVESSVQAESTADTALNMTVQSGRPLVSQGGEAVNLSTAVLQHSQDLLNTTEGLKLTVSSAITRLGLVRESVHNISHLLPQPISQLHSLANGTSELFQLTRQQTAVAQSNVQEALQRLEQLRAQLERSSSVVEQANDTVTSTNTMVTHSHSTANEAQGKLEEAELRTKRLMERMKPLSLLGETLGRNLSDIRELINQARRQAASIKVAVQADRDCVRSYRPDVASSNFNTLSLTLKTTSPDNLLFYMGSTSTVDFLALEMRGGRVSLLWDAGSGSARLEYPHLDITNNHWTRINATRFGVHSSLSVHQLDSGSGPSPPVTASSPGLATVMDVDSNTVIYVGGLGAKTKKPSALAQSSFQGCMGEASLNEKNIGLWNYREREGTCRGCFTSPQSEETSFHFDGSGYSVVEKSLRSTTTSVVLLFKTLSPTGLLLYLASNGTRDFLSMELVEGRVRLTFDLGSGALSMTSTRAYNTGIWYKITLQRNKRKGYLSIMAADQSSEKEVLEAESPGTASDLNRSDLDPIYIGGLPASRPIRRQVVSRSYVGCIKNVEIARSNFDLLRDSYGVKKGCVLEAVRSVSVLREGFVQLSDLSLGQQGELLLSFSTKNESGLILAGFTKPSTLRRRRHAKQAFLAVQLVSGRLEVELSLGGGASHRVVVKPRSGVLADGAEHSLVISRDRKTLSVQVDENHMESVSLSAGGGALSLSSVFIGGLPRGEGLPLPSRLQSASFHGCIRNIAVDGVLIDLSGAVRYVGVELDSCLLEERASGAVLPDDPEVEPTPDPAQPPPAPPTQLSALTPGTLTCSLDVEPGFLSSGVQFGLSRHSHMTLNINPGTVRKSFSVKLSVRTHAQSGLVYYMAHANQMDYATLQLVGGRLVFTVDLGKGAASVSTETVSDGQWHTVRTDLSKRSIRVSVDSVSSSPVSVKGNTLDVQHTLFLGGLPGTYTAKRIGNITHSLAGCLQAVSLNNTRLNTLSPASQHNTASCFTNDQTGSYFNGTGYAALMHDGYKVGSDMSVSMDFRTSQSEAVLLGISSAKVDAIGLEIINGQVVFHVNNGAGRVSVVSPGGVCDGRWHHLVAKKTKHTLSLTVDGLSSVTHNPHPQSTSAETNNPVYIGGYPVGVKQNCLSVRTWFRGCLRSVRLSKTHASVELDPAAAFSQSGVTAHSCPAA